MSPPREVALEALGHYGIGGCRVILAAESFNTVFRVVADSGTYALRVGAPARIHAEGTLEAEHAWLSRLGADGIVVPRLFANAGGRLGTKVMSDAGVRTCALFDWVPGRVLRSRLTGPTARALGRLAAALHHDAEAWALAEPPDVLVADTVLSFRLPIRLTAPDVPMRAVFGDALERAQSVLDQLWHSPPHRPYLLHGDLTPPNVIVRRDARLVPIDFQDLIWGFDVQDLAITIAALCRAPGGARLCEAFQEAYTAERPWPEVAPEVFDTLLAARVLNQANLTLNLRPPADLDGYLHARAHQLEQWLRSGQLRFADPGG